MLASCRTKSGGVGQTLLFAGRCLLYVRGEHIILCLLFSLGLLLFAFARRSRGGGGGFLLVLLVEFRLFLSLLAFSLHCVQNKSIFVFATAQRDMVPMLGAPYALFRSSLSSHHLQPLQFQPCCPHLVRQQQFWSRSKSELHFRISPRSLDRLLKFECQKILEKPVLQSLTCSVGSHSGAGMTQGYSEGPPGHPERSGQDFRRRAGVPLANRGNTAAALRIDRRFPNFCFAKVFGRWMTRTTNPKKQYSRLNEASVQKSFLIALRTRPLACEADGFPSFCSSPSSQTSFIHE